MKDEIDKKIINEELLRAANLGQKKLVESLLNKGADVNAKGNYGRTALIKAARKGHRYVVKLLIKHGADVNAKDSEGETALMKAAYWIHRDIVELLIKHGADVNARDNDGETALMKAACVGDRDIAELLIEYGADVNAKDNRGENALMKASSWRGHKDIVELLIKHGADVNAKDNDGNTALMKAAWGGYRDIVELLIKHGADINAKDNDGNTALIKAASKGHRDVVELLIKCEADVNAKNNEGKTALMKSWRYNDIANLLKKAMKFEESKMAKTTEKNWKNVDNADSAKNSRFDRKLNIEKTDAVISFEKELPRNDPIRYLESLRNLLVGLEKSPGSVDLTKMRDADDSLKIDLIKEILKHPKLLDPLNVEYLFYQAYRGGNFELMDAIVNNENLEGDFLDEVFENSWIESQTELARSPFLSKQIISRTLELLARDDTELKSYALGLELIKNLNATQESVSNWCNLVEEYGNQEQKEKMKAALEESHKQVEFVSAHQKFEELQKENKQLKTQLNEKDSKISELEGLLRKIQKQLADLLKKSGLHR